MEIQIANAEEARQAAAAAGFTSVEDYVNRLIQKDADLRARCGPEGHP